LQKFPNKRKLTRFFIFEDLKVAAGHVTLSEAMALARTEEDQLELAVREHARLVYRIAYSVLRNHEDAEDATQETFIRALRARRKLPTVEDPKRWLARIAWRVAVARRKKVVEVGIENVAQLRADADRADDQVLGGEMAGLLQRLISSLPGKLRAPLLLSTLEEMSTPDIAATLKVKEAAIRSRLFRARQILRQRLGALLEGKHEG
jgi:RNA polymerase sigma-70 factor (ECF subfamily)